MPKEEVVEKKSPDKINQEMAKAARTYMRMNTRRRRTGKGAYVGDLEINKMISDMVKVYSDTIEEYSALAEGEKERSDEIDTFLEAAAQQGGDYTYENASVTSLVRKHAARAGAVYEEKDPEAEAEAAEEAEQNLSAGQKQGLRDIAKWMYRNTLRQGNKDWIKNLWSKYIKGSDQRVTSFDRHNYVDHIMQKSEREKLLIYYLVENRKTNGKSAITPEDVKASQSYTPDLENFKNRIIATKWKFWKRAFGSEIYWEKLGTAAQLAEEQKFYLAAYAEQEQDSEENAEKEAEDEIEREDQEIIEEMSGENAGQEPKAKEEEEGGDATGTVDLEKVDESFSEEGDNSRGLDIKELEKIGDLRTKHMKRFQAYLEQYQSYVLKRDDLLEGTEEYANNEALIKTTEKSLQGAMADIVAQNERLPEADELLADLKKSIGDNPGKNNVGQDTDANKAAKYIGFGALGAGSIAGSGVGALSSVGKILKIDLAGVTAINYTSGALCSLGALAKFASSFSLMVNLMEMEDLQTEEENEEQGWRVARGLAEGVSMSAKGVTNIVQSVEKASYALKEASEAATNAVAAGTQFLAGVGMVTEVITLSESMTRLQNAEANEEKLAKIKEAKEKRRNKKNAGKLTENERREDLLDSRLAMKNNQKKRSAAFDMVGSTISFVGNAVTIMGPLSPVGMALTLIGTGLKAIGTLWNLWESYTGKKETVYGFFGVNEAYEELVQTSGYDERLTKDPDAVKDELRHMILAQLNLFSINQGYYYAVRKMAEVLFFKTFFKDDHRRLITQKDLRTPDFSYVNKEYIPRMEVLGFKPSFPKEERQNGYPQITIDMLMVKLQ